MNDAPSWLSVRCAFLWCCLAWTLVRSLQRCSATSDRSKNSQPHYCKENKCACTQNRTWASATLYPERASSLVWDRPSTSLFREYFSSSDCRKTKSNTYNRWKHQQIFRCWEATWMLSYRTHQMSVSIDSEFRFTICHWVRLSKTCLLLMTSHFV